MYDVGCYYHTESLHTLFGSPFMALKTLHIIAEIHEISSQNIMARMGIACYNEQRRWNTQIKCNTMYHKSLEKTAEQL